MTDWLPWGLVTMTGTFATLWAILNAVAAIPGVDLTWVRRARTILWTSAALSYATFLMYIVKGEGWIWY
jgi:hypothetical protein